MNKTKKAIILAVAILLILAGIGAAVFALTQNNDDDIPEVDGTTAEIHADTEYLYDNDGNVRSEIYYKDNEYIGRRDYTKDNDTKKEYITDFDADMNETFASVTEFNMAGSISKVTTYDHTVLASVTEYDYYDDMRSIAKKTTKTFEGEDELAEKIYYSESGKKTQVCKYLNGELLEEIFYDENGNVINNGGDTVED